MIRWDNVNNYTGGVVLEPTCFQSLLHTQITKQWMLKLETESGHAYAPQSFKARLLYAGLP